MARQSIARIRCLASSSSGLLSHHLPRPSSTTASLLSPPRSSRNFSTAPPTQRQTPSYLTVPSDKVPDYPYGRFTTYKQRNQGLFGRSKIRFGNVVAEKYGNKSRTHWLPNRHTKRLWSPSLQAFIRTRLTASVLHTIDKLGGIDEYLLGGKAKRIKELGPAGWALRWKVMQTPAVRERFARERAALGLPPKENDPVLVDSTTDTAAATGAGTQDFPAELAAQGLDSKAVLDEVDAMIERDEEFVLGDPATDAEIKASARADAMGEKPTATQPQKPE